MADLHIVDSTTLPWTPHRTFPGVDTQTVIDARTGVDVEVKTIRVAPHAEIALHTHEGSAETFYILSGEGLICTDHRTQPCYPGTCVHAKSGVVHGIKNTEEGDLRLLAIFAPPTGTPLPQTRPDLVSSSDQTGQAGQNP